VVSADEVIAALSPHIRTASSKRRERVACFGALA
jgi:hypothetical protein